LISIPTHAPDISEHVLQRLILGRLVIMPGCAVLAPDGTLTGDPYAVAIFWRQNVVAVAAADRFVRAGVRGQADIGGVVKSRAYGLEIKRRAGRRSPAQRTYEEHFTRAGGVYVVAWSLADALVPVCRALELPYEITRAEAIAT
jgi:hypothetical protein